ncbi:recombinase family protein [Kitasatospora sp. NPDC050463]|uniref:recombinase family protein n=1 Tax=Kitasatospora sp. NPDC050463 TaxID=3155786 RepID=UPI0033FD9501
MPGSERQVEDLVFTTEPWLLLVARVSDSMQIDALPAQKKRLLEYASRQARPFAYVEFDETAYKGARAVFRKKVIDPILRARSLAIVTFDKIDRFSRDSSSDERALFGNLLKQGRIELHFPSDNLFIHRDSPAPDLFRLDIGVALSSYYASSTRDNVKRKFEEMVEDRGEWIAKAPIGYRNIDTGVHRDGPKSRTIKDIKPDDRSRHLAVMAFELRATGMSYSAVTKKLRKAGMVSSEKGRPIPKRQVEHLLQNPFYMGQMRYRGRLYPHKYEPLIPRWLWKKVQEVNERRSTGRTKYASKEHLYRDRIHCGICGYTVLTDGPKKGKYYYLKCTEYGGKHGAKWVNEWQITEQVASRVFANIRIPDERVPSLLKELEQDSEQEARFHKEKIRRLRAEHSRLDEEVKDMFRDRHRFTIRPELFDELVSEKTDRQAEIGEQIDQIESNNSPQFLKSAKGLVKLASQAQGLFLSEDVRMSQKNKLLSIPLSNLTWDGENIDFELKKPYAAISSCQDNDNWRALVSKFRTECRAEILALGHDINFRELTSDI